MPISARILVVDDEKSILAALELALEDTAWRIETAGSAEEALAKLAGAEFDALLTDKNLPGVDGIELVRQLRARGSDVGVVVMTGYASAESAAAALNLGVDAYLEKPFDDIFAVAKAVQKALDARARRRKAATPPATKRDGRMPLTLVVGAPELRRAQIAGHLDRTLDTVEFAATPSELLAATARTPRAVLILEGTVAIADHIEAVRAARPDASCVVFARRLPLAVIQRLIELEVKWFLTGAPEDADFGGRLDEILDHFRARTLIKSLSGPR